MQNVRNVASKPAIVLGTAFTLGLFLTGLRIIILRAELNNATPVDSLALVARGSLQDWTILFFIAVITLALNYGNSAELQFRWSGVAFIMLGNLTLLLGITNVLAVGMLGEPLTLSWMKYSDIFNSYSTFDSILHLISPGMVLAVAAAMVVFNAISLLSAIQFNRWPKSGWKIIFCTAPYAALLITVSASAGSIPQQNIRGKLSSPSLAFVFSLYSKERYTPEFVQQDGDHPLETAAPSIKPEIKPGQIKNVVFFILESMPAKYAQGFDGQYPVTPNLLKHSAIGRRFTNAYSHAPASTYFLISLTAAIVPELSTNPMTYSYPNLRLDTIVSVLNERGFRSGYFDSADSRFQDADKYMVNSGFETVLDHRDWPCDVGVYENSYPDNEFLNTGNDLCTVGPMLDWIKQEPDRPFVVMMRTGMTHYPYFPGEQSRDYVEDEDLNRYLNAVRVGDEAFGMVMDYLTENDMLDATLVVVVGDHGEAFGEHGTISHASGIYDENLRVPLMLINPQLFSGGTSDVVTGVFDLAPTVLDILDIPAPPSWQGHSVFAEGRPASVLFFTPWNGFQIGFRQGTTKFIYNANSEEASLFDLAADPNEQNNLASQDPSATNRAKRILGQLVRNQNAWIDRLLRGAGEFEPLAASSYGPRQLKIHATGTRFRTAPKARISVDGEEVGHIEINAAPSNAETTASDEQIAAATTTFTLPLAQTKCSRRVEIQFLKDEWEGEGQTGDTDLFIDSVELDGTVYRPQQFELITKRAGGKRKEYFVMWRTGAFQINLNVGPDCISSALASR